MVAIRGWNTFSSYLRMAVRLLQPGRAGFHGGSFDVFRQVGKMKIGNRSSEGSALTVILVIVVVIGVTLASYLGLVANQNLSIQRSQAWNSGIPIAEAGIEEALAHLNRNGTNRIGDGWVLAP